MKDIFAWEIRNNFPEADFWIQNSGSAETLGTVTREFQPFLTDIKCSDMIDPGYGYYLCQYLHQIGTWKERARGSIKLQHLRISDVQTVFKEIARSHREQVRYRYKNFVPTKPKDRALTA